MTIIKKAAISLVITLIVFSAFTIISFFTLFDLIESRFYNKKVLTEVENRIENIIIGIEEYKNDRIEILTAVSNEAAIRNSFLINQSREDIFQRENIIKSLIERRVDFDFIRVIDDAGRIHYSSNPIDLQSADPTRISYRILDAQSIERYREIIERAGDIPAIFFDIQDHNLFVASVYSHIGIRRGTILVYLAPNDLRSFLARKNVIERNIVIRYLAHNKIVFNILDGNISILEELKAYWTAGEIRNPHNLYSDAAGTAFSVVTKRWGDGFIGYVIPDHLIKINAIYKYILLFSVFSITFILSFLLMNIRQDQVVVIADRVKRFQINFLIEYLENKSEVEWRVWKKELESRKEELRREFKKGIRRLDEDKDKIVNDLVDKSWDEIISLLAGHLEKKSESKNLVTNLQVDNIEEIIRKIIASENNIRRKDINTVSSPQVVAQVAEVAGADAEEELEEIEEADEVADAVEEAEELEDADLEEIEEAEAVEVAVEEELERIEEAAKVSVREADKESATAEPLLDENKKFEELITTYKDYGEEIANAKEIQNTVEEIERTIVPITDDQDEADLKKLTSFRDGLENDDTNIPELIEEELLDEEDMADLEDLDIEEAEMLEEKSVYEKVPKKYVSETEKIENLETIGDFKPLVIDSEFEELEVLEKTEADEDDDDKARIVEYIRNDIVGVYKPNYMPDFFYSRKKTEKKEEDFAGEISEEKIETCGSPKASSAKHLETLKKEGLLEIWTIKDVIKIIEEKKESPVIEKDGILKISENLYNDGNTSKNADEDNEIGISDIFFDDAIDLPVFSDASADAPVADEKYADIKISEEYGFYADIFYDHNENNPIEIIKILFEITKKMGSSFGVILVQNDKKYYPEVSVGLFNKDYPELLRINKDSYLFREFLAERKIFFIKTDITELEELNTKFSPNDLKKINGLLFAPMRYKGKQAYFVAAPDAKDFYLDSVILKVKNFQK
ncbi:MAG: hypothetical protein FWC36_10100 [Spirochaetes bacterium]|nr:hypothetical protein [Spirochaetota bacterium]